MRNGQRWLRALLLLTVAIFGSQAPCRAADHFAEIKKRGELLWGTDAEGGAPYVYVDPQDPTRFIGFEYELAEAIAAKLGVKAKIVQNQWDQLVPALDRGNFDIIINGLEITPEHQQHIAMTQPYYVYAQQIITHSDQQRISEVKDLEGKRVGVLQNSASEQLLKKSTNVDLRSYPGNVESLRDIKAGRIDAAVMDLPIALFYSKPDPALRFAGPSFAPGYYGIGVRKDDVSLLAALNWAISELDAEHTLERIYRKYGLWDERQETLRNYQPQQVQSAKKISTLR